MRLYTEDGNGGYKPIGEVIDLPPCETVVDVDQAWTPLGTTLYGQVLLMVQEWWERVTARR